MFGYFFVYYLYPAIFLGLLFECLKYLEPPHVNVKSFCSWAMFAHTQYSFFLVMYADYAANS